MRLPRKSSVLTRRAFQRRLTAERLEPRLLLANDLDDAFGEALSLGALSTTPATVNASISPDTDVDMYRFSVSGGQTADFDIDTPFNGPAGLGSYIRLFNAQGQELSANNDAAAPGENAVGFDSYLRYTFPAGGTYYLGVSNANNRQYNPVTGANDTAGGPYATGNYQLIVQALPVDTNDSLVEATFLGAVSTTPTTISSSIVTDIDVNLYRVTAAPGQVVDFDIDTPLNGPGGLGSYLRIFNAQGQEVAANDNARSPGESVAGFDAYLRYTFPTAGAYYVGVSNSNNTTYNPLTGGGDTAGGPNSIGSYQLTIQAQPPAVNDPDDALSEATALGSVSVTPISVAATINPDVDVDMYRFSVAAGQTIDFDIDTALNGPGGLGSFLRLFNAQGQELAANNDAAAPGENTVGYDAYLRYTFSSAGAYYVGVSNYINRNYESVTGKGDTAGGTDTTGDYQLTIQALPVDPDDSLAKATSLGAVSTTSQTINAEIATDIDVDLYRFTAGAGQTVDFDIDTPLNGPGGLGSYLRLFNAQGQQLAVNDNAAAPGENVVGYDAHGHRI